MVVSQACVSPSESPHLTVPVEEAHRPWIYSVEAKQMAGEQVPNQNFTRLRKS